MNTQLSRPQPSSSPPSLRRRVHQFLDPNDGMTPPEAAFNALLASLIVLTILSSILATLPQAAPHLGWMRAAELFAAVVFTAEYLGRAWTLPERLGREATLADHLAHATSLLPLIDLVVILALFSPASWAVGALRGLRLLKLLSVLKLGRYSEGLQLVGRVLASRSGELLTLILIVLVLMFIAASLLHQVEHAAGTKGFETVPAAMWWAVVTLTTTGYGDVYPVTSLGKLLAGVIMLGGVGMVALPAGIVAAGFSEATAQQRQLHEAALRRAALVRQGVAAHVRFVFAGGQSLDLPYPDCAAAEQALAEWQRAKEARRALWHAVPGQVTDLTHAWRAEIEQLIPGG
ncbi:ion transporter [Deinococcus sp. NW-56]|uniref:ion transporter n=1 Tax=Deinococcus sp. NW-56 TaxID=2080419 RepID=UPI001F1A1F38|nr:ion transporter [Deinococcus sp. NW-56]